jgi:type IV secretion system protein TrbL
MFAWTVVLLSFFILAIQLFVTLIEFKLTTLAGFVLIPFGLFGKTAFLAERVLGNVVSSGVKVLVLTVIVGIGSTLFQQFTAGFSGAQPSVDDAMALVLAALSLLGLGIFGPAVANGIVSGGPQLGAGAVVGTGFAAGGAVLAGAGTARMAGGALTRLAGKSETQAAAALPPSRWPNPPGGAPSSGGYPPGPGGSPGGGPAGAAHGGPSSQFADAAPIGSASSFMAPNAARIGVGEPAWAKRMKRSQSVAHGLSLAAHSLRAGDSHGAGTTINLSETR